MYDTPAQHPSRQRQTTQADSFFGMALAQAFTGIAFGPAADMAWEAAETASTVRDDRMGRKAGGEPASFVLGAKNSLAGTFASMSAGIGAGMKSLAELERETFRPAAFSMKAPALAA
ncbi:MAG: hypothetical protein WC989_04540 [Micavibrio sp.]